MNLHNISKVWERGGEESRLRVLVKEYLSNISIKVIYLCTTGSQASVISGFELDLSH